MNQIPSVNPETDEFMKRFKYYKSNNPKPSLEQVIQVDNVDMCSPDLVPVLLSNEAKEDTRTDLLGLKSAKEWRIYTFRRHPGLILINNPFKDSGQRYWIRKCLEKYPRKPNRLNIDVEGYYQDWWHECFKDNSCDKQLLKKLRWTTLGYHHNWDTKVYSEDNKTPFPNDLAELCYVFAKCLGFEDFRAEAAIVNYYHMNSTLSAHTDHSEVNLEAPLFSFSFGQSAIFLIGGKEKTIEPSAILVKSGDVIIMSKDTRLCYHAVPKILPSPSSPWDRTEELEMKMHNPDFKYLVENDEIITLMKQSINNKEWERFRDYIQESRINMNVRQVLNKTQSSLRD